MIFMRISNYMTYRIAATLQLLVFFFIAVFAFQPLAYEPTDGGAGLRGYTDTQPWPKFFHVPVLMLMLITLLNDGERLAGFGVHIIAH